ncbi:hypothetical protein [Nocardioides sp. CER19]|uniref:hypothetical protein n=1 Tax=Nocardioides sp. CER19 TaxID=3038538 RepID=UPI00244BBA07|nr:hypothetical protein [Nocardioides sp. CER19]MDH2416199.1 hypothetical protein [Nocardioides sp. CER19]
MRIDLRPPTDAAGITIGASRPEAIRSCRALGSPSDFHRGNETSVSLVVERPSGLVTFVYFDSTGSVEAIEFGRPTTDTDVVEYAGVDVFGTPAEELARWLSEHTRVEVADEGRSITAPDLLLALWRPVIPLDLEDEDGRFFESVLLAESGYNG